MARKGSTIPRTAQVPMAIALIVVFAGVLFWRFAQKAEPTVEASGRLEEISSVQLAELKSLIDRAELGTPSRVMDLSRRQPLKRDPFVRAEVFSPGSHRITAEGSPVVGEAGDTISSRAISRQEFLDSAMLSSVFVMGNRSVVILNDQYLHLGDKVGGFVVERIFEDRIVLEDPLGLETLWVGKLSRGEDERPAEEANS